MESKKFDCHDDVLAEGLECKHIAAIPLFQSGTQPLISKYSRLKIFSNPKRLS
jgi:hypothetical protein